MKKILIALCLILFTACKPSAETTEDYVNKFHKEQVEKFLNMELGEETWIYQIHIIRIPGGWILSKDGVAFIPYTIVNQELTWGGV